jgi:hypothetical protein
MSLFWRKVELIIGDITVRDLDVRFAVQLDDKNIGTAEITVFNFNEMHRKKLEQTPSSAAVEVSLSAGYVGRDMHLLFKGDIRQITSVRRPPDWVTTIRTGDGDGAPQSRMSTSYPKGTDFSKVIKDAYDALKKDAKIEIGNLMAAIGKGQAAEKITSYLSGGGSVQGKALKILKDSCRKLNLDVQIQHKQLVVTQLGKPLEAPIPLLCPETGLIGSPEKVMKKEQALVNVRSLIQPGLLPKRVVQIESKMVSGFYVIQGVKYTGDTHGEEWYADMECIAK